jgi:predicted DCC family thiol-disulfide oxidoreductase YuxK|tara:strand:+ start:93 stop:503 length:411 start_codon:yes stop_codon:yes gene_type:complete
MNTKSKHKIILFDGLCNLCNTSVNFVIRNDKKGVFRFAPIQTNFGESTLKKYHINTKDTDSIILIDKDKYYIKSTAALYIAKELAGAYPLLFCFMIVPKFIRNLIYDLVAKNRYKWFGKKVSCMIPTPELKDKFYS